MVSKQYCIVRLDVMCSGANHLGLLEVRLNLRANSPKYSVNDLPLGNCSYLCDSACLAITSPEQASLPSLETSRPKKRPAAKSLLRRQAGSHSEGHNYHKESSNPSASNKKTQESKPDANIEKKDHIGKSYFNFCQIRKNIRT